MYNRQLADYHPCSIRFLVLPLDLTSTLPVHLLLFSVNLPYTLS